VIDQQNSKRVPFLVNALLTLAFIFQSFVTSFLFAREDLTKGKAHISTFPFIKDHKVLELIVGIIAMVIAALLFVWIFRQVWNRVLSKRSGFQEICFSEAYAISILLFAITSWF
jgi:hypothetical protein